MEIRHFAEAEQLLEGDKVRKGEKTMTTRFYAAYGSNLNIHQMRLRCPNAKVVGTAEIKDYELLFKGSRTGSYLTIEKKKGSKVPVALWETAEADEKSLDRYEGFPVFYYKAEMKLKVKDIKTGKIRCKNCYIYIMHEDRAVGVPSDFYVETCLEGYRTFGFDEKFILTALEKSRRLCREE